MAWRDVPGVDIVAGLTDQQHPGRQYGPRRPIRLYLSRAEADDLRAQLQRELQSDRANLEATLRGRVMVRESD